MNNTIKEDTLEIEITPEFEGIPVCGNAVASGDDDFDKEIEDEILDRLESGDEWAWCCVAVTVRKAGFEATNYLGCCCYEDEEDFKQGGYYESMIEECLREIAAKIESDQSGEH